MTLDLADVCGDCKRGQCHGADPEDCGCRLHDASIAAAEADTAPPGHRPNALPHGYVYGACGDHCDNRACRRGLPHDQCTPACLTEHPWTSHD